MTYGIIGAGIAGLSAAQGLAARGEAVVLFDKGRGPGGRLSSRRAQTPYGQMRFDHGTSCFSASDRQFNAWLERLEKDGVAAPWTGNFVSLDAAGRATPLMDETRWVGTPRMNAIVRNLADQHHVHWSKRIVQIGSVDEGWLVETDEGERAGPFKRLIVAIPAEQAAVLLDGVDQALAKRAGRARSKPCWSVMCAFAEPVSVPWDGAQLLGNALSWCSRERSKPKRERAEAWVLHASREWSTANLEVEPDVAAAELVRAFRELTGAPIPGFLSAHRWRYSQPEVTNPAMHVWRDDFSLGVCGDWCGGGTVEAAWMSGVSIVEALGE